MSWSPQQTSLWKIYWDSDDTRERARAWSQVQINRAIISPCQRRRYVRGAIVALYWFFWGVSRRFCCYLRRGIETSLGLHWVALSHRNNSHHHHQFRWVSLDHGNRCSSEYGNVYHNISRIWKSNIGREWAMRTFEVFRAPRSYGDYRFIRRVGERTIDVICPNMVEEFTLEDRRDRKVFHHDGQHEQQ